MALCPNCNARLAITATDCQKCGALFANGGWYPIPTSPAEDQHAAERVRAIASTQGELSAPDGRRPANKALIIGIAIATSPIWLTLLSLPACMLGSGAGCVLGPFLWFALWPAYLVGFGIIAVASFSSKGGQSPIGGLRTLPKQEPKSFLRCAKCAVEISSDTVLCPKCGFRFGGTAP